MTSTLNSAIILRDIDPSAFDLIDQQWPVSQILLALRLYTRDGGFRAPRVVSQKHSLCSKWLHF